MADDDHRTLVGHILELKGKMADMNVVVATTRSAVEGQRAAQDRRHQENKVELARLHKGITESNAAVKRVDGKVGRLEDRAEEIEREVRVMRPVVRRLRARELVRRTIVKCLTRWRTMFVALGVSIGGVVTWLDGTWPKLAAKVAALLRRIGGGG